MVEYAAPGGLGEPDPGAEHGGDHAARHAADGGLVLALQHRRGDGAGTLHHPGAGMNWYIVGSYAVTFVLLALEVFLLTRRAKKLETKT